MNHANEHGKLYETQMIIHKGKGLIARDYIEQGARIASEKPILVFSELSNEEEVTAKLKSVSTQDQDSILSYHNDFPDSKYPLLGIVSTNSLPLGDTARCGIFPIIRHVNHNCIPNAHYSWNDSSGSGNIHALRDINIGEEITIRYDNLEPSFERRAILKEDFGFCCNCNLCSESPINIQRSDYRRRRIKVLEIIITDQLSALTRPGSSLAVCRELIQLLREECGKAVDSLMAETYFCAFQVAIAHGDQARAKTFIERAYNLRVICTGEDNDRLCKWRKLLEDPTKDESFGILHTWENSIRIIPNGVDDDKWVWERAKTT